MNLHLVPPRWGLLPEALGSLRVPDYESTIDEIQRFRGRIYVQDEALPPTALDLTGRHRSTLDYRAWHLVTRNPQGLTMGVMRVPFYVAGTPVDEFGFAKVLERMNRTEQIFYKTTIQQFIDESAQAGYTAVGEPGGWAVDKALCNRQTGLNLALATFALHRLQGRTVAVATATVKHHAADLLKMLGAFNPFEGTGHARFYDPFFRCEMEFLFVYAEKVAERFEGVVVKLMDHLHFSSTVIDRSGL
ncbi:hypothetical protein [Tellurirhabdus rosea]|uniref:hypothetical protein n=1 Tax=Tellurirhabdus rosea TaxID=2674997 RepID=UPI002251A3D6|nr:hypothetical protein [Tellurirhabdus rosea]